ncbi:MAG: ABC transporter permease [Acidobacteriota bacterium]
MSRRHQLWGFLVRDFLQEYSYRTNFVMQLVGLAGSLTLWFFLGRFLSQMPQVTQRLGGMDYFSYSVIGLALLRYLSSLNSTFSRKVRQEQVTGTLEAMLVTPNRTPSLIMMSSAYDVLSSSVWILAWIVLGRLFGASFHLPALLPTILLLALVMAAFASIGILSAGMVIYFKRGNPLNWLVSSSSALLGGVFFPISALPAPLDRLAQYIPITHAVEGLRQLVVRQAGMTAILSHLQFLAVFGVIILPAGLGLFHLALRRARYEGTLVHY